MKKYLGIILFATLILTGCRAVPQLQNGQDIMVELDGKQFTADDFFIKLKELNGVSALIELVDDWIVEQEVTDEMREQSQIEARAQLEQVKASFGDNWINALNANGFQTEQEYLDFLIRSVQKRLVIAQYIKDEVITERQIERYYKNEIFGAITARHILVIPEVTAGMTNQQREEAEEAALNKAKGFITTLNNSENVEEKFIELAKEHSDDSGSAKEGGLISDFTNHSGLVKEFWDESLRLNDGQFSQVPIETQFGFHIIYRVSQKEKPSLDEVRALILDNLVEEILEEDNAMEIHWSRLREKYNMVIHDHIIKSNYNTIMSNIKREN